MNYFVLLLLALLTFGSRLYYIKKKKLKFNVKELFILLFLLYLLLFIKMTLLKDKEFTFSLGSMIKQAQFMLSFTFTDGYSQLIKTILIAIPFGFFISCMLANHLNYKQLIKYGLLISLIFETLKLFKMNEIWNMNDILLMTTGLLIGGFNYQILYKLLKSIKKENWLDALKDVHPAPIKKSWKLIFCLIAAYILGAYTTLVSQTYPLSILDKSKVIRIEQFEIKIEEKLSHLNITGYYKTNFNRLKRLYLTKFELNEEPIYDVYTLIEPYKPQTDINYGILVIGWIDQPSTLKITYEDTSYLVDLQPGFFAVGYPGYVSEIPILNLHARSMSNLNITFYDELNNIIEIPFKKETLD